MRTDSLSDALSTKAHTEWYSEAFNFVLSTAGSGETYRANRKEFTKWQIVPRMLRDCTHRNLDVRHTLSSSPPYLHTHPPHATHQTTLFGIKYPTPLLIAPIGCQGVLHADAELATARAAGTLGIPLVLSGAASRSLEAVAEANGPGSARWFQLYW